MSSTLTPHFDSYEKFKNLFHTRRTEYPIGSLWKFPRDNLPYLKIIGYRENSILYQRIGSRDIDTVHEHTLRDILICCS